MSGPKDSASTPSPLAPAPDPLPENAIAPADKVPLAAKAAYALGGVNDIYGHWWYANIAGNVFNMHLHLDSFLVGLVMGLARIVDGFTDTFFGWVSDNTRTRWGRRRPYILFGSIAAGIALPCLFLASESWDAAAPWHQNKVFWFMIGTTFLYAPLISLYTMPYSSLGSELTPHYHERTNVMAWKGVVQKVSGVYMMGVWWLAHRYHVDPVTHKADVMGGVVMLSAIAGGVMILAGLANFVFVRERYYDKARLQTRTAFWVSCRQTVGSKPFLILLGILGVYAVPTALVTGLGGYVSAYYVFGGDQETMGKFQFYASIAYAVFGTTGVFVTTWISNHRGKRRALVFTLTTGIVAFGSSWWMYTPGNGWLIVANTALTGFAATGFWVVLPSMCADVVDDDEEHTCKRREGAFTSLFSWTSKVGGALALFATGSLLKLAGFDPSLEGNQHPETVWWIRFLFVTIPVAAMLIALGFLAIYPLSQARMAAIRAELEARRGTV